MTGKTAVLTVTILAFAVSVAFAAGSVSKGKALFNDPKFAGAKSGMSCNTCHPGGKGLEESGNTKEFHVAGKTQKSLEEAVNACIEYAIGGKALGPKSDAMKDIVAYIKSLKSKS
jgi:cytochrome c